MKSVNHPMTPSSHEEYLKGYEVTADSRSWLLSYNDSQPGYIRTGLNLVLIIALLPFFLVMGVHLIAGWFIEGHNLFNPLHDAYSHWNPTTLQEAAEITAADPSTSLTKYIVEVTSPDHTINVFEAHPIAANIPLYMLILAGLLLVAERRFRRTVSKSWFPRAMESELSQMKDIMSIEDDELCNLYARWFTLNQLVQNKSTDIPADVQRKMLDIETRASWITYDKLNFGSKSFVAPKDFNDVQRAQLTPRKSNRALAVRLESGLLSDITPTGNVTA